MRKLSLIMAVLVWSGIATSCAPAATDQELNDMCGNLVDLRSQKKIPTEEEVLSKVEKSFKSKEKNLKDWKNNDTKFLDNELKTKLEKLKSDKEKKALEEDYDKKKEIGTKKFDADTKALGQAKAEEIEEAKDTITKQVAKRAESVKKCVEEAKKEGINQTLAQCRIKAQSKDKYWNACK